MTGIRTNSSNIQLSPILESLRKTIQIFGQMWLRKGLYLK